MAHWITVNDKMQQGYQYQLVCAPGEDFAADFQPQVTPQANVTNGCYGRKIYD